MLNDSVVELPVPWEKGEVFSPLMVLCHFCSSKTTMLSPYFRICVIIAHDTYCSTRNFIVAVNNSWSKKPSMSPVINTQYILFD